MQVQEIEDAIRNLPTPEKRSLALKVNDLYWDAWDEQIEDDFASGKPDSLIAKAEQEIQQGNVKTLDEVLRDS